MDNDDEERCDLRGEETLNSILDRQEVKAFHNEFNPNIFSSLRCNMPIDGRARAPVFVFCLCKEHGSPCHAGRSVGALTPARLVLSTGHHTDCCQALKVVSWETTQELHELKFVTWQWNIKVEHYLQKEVGNMFKFVLLSLCDFLYSVVSSDGCWTRQQCWNGVISCICLRNA